MRSACSRNGCLTAVLLLAFLATSSSIPAQAADTVSPLRLSIGVSLSKLILVVAQEAGLYKKNGLDVELSISPRGVEMAKRSGLTVPAEFVQKGAAQEGPISTSGGTPLITALTTNPKTIPGVMIATTGPIAMGSIVGGNGFSSLEQLKGKRLGYSGHGSETHYMAIMFARKMGWEPGRDILLTPGASGVDALRSGAADAIVADELTRALAESAGFNTLQELGKWNIPIAGHGINASKAWLKDNRDVAQRLVKSLAEAVALMKKDKQATVQAMVKWFNITDPRQQDLLYSGVAALPRKPYPAVEGVKMAMEVYDGPQMRKFKLEDFYDDSIVRALDQSGELDSLYR